MRQDTSWGSVGDLGVLLSILWILLNYTNASLCLIVKKMPLLQFTGQLCLFLEGHYKEIPHIATWETMAHYKGAAKEAGRAANLLKKRAREQEEAEAKKKKIEEELAIGSIHNKFATHYDAIEQSLKSSTIGNISYVFTVQ